MNLKEFLEKNAISLITIIITLVLMFGGFNWKLDDVDIRVKSLEALKLEVQMMEIQTDLKHIRQSLDKAGY